MFVSTREHMFFSCILNSYTISGPEIQSSDVIAEYFVIIDAECLAGTEISHVWRSASGIHVYADAVTVDYAYFPAGVY